MRSCVWRQGKYRVMRRASTRGWLWCVARRLPHVKVESWVMLPTPQNHSGPHSQNHTPGHSLERLCAEGSLFQIVAMQTGNQKVYLSLWSVSVTENEARLALHMASRVGRDYGLHSEGDFRLGFTELQRSEQAAQGRRVRLSQPLGCLF